MSASSFVALRGVSFSWDQRPLFSNLDLQLSPGWTGVVGANGAGKSTLLDLIDGARRPDAGVVQTSGRVVRADQRDGREGVDDFALDWGRDAVRWRARLRLDPDDVERWSTLSPGQRRRWRIGAALAADADVLLLDEPTNHLDAEARALLRDGLLAWRGVGVLVAHDRALLDAVTTRTARVHGGRVTLYDAPYSTAREQWELAARQRLEALEDAQDARRAAEQRLADARRERDATTVSTGRSGRMRNAHDSDARTLGAATRAAWAESGAGRRVELIRREVGRLDEVVREAAVERSFGRTVFVGYERRAKARISAFSGTLMAGERALAHVDVQLHRDDRVRLAGPNGIGKTTLLRALLGDAPEDDVLWLPQQLSEEDAAGDLAHLHALSPDVRGRVLQHVAALGVDPTQLLATARPSPGEARKLRLALGLGRHVAALVLDEPTNDLDLPAVERLEATLADWPGAVLLVTHDDAFAAAATSVTWTLGADGLRVA